MARAKSLLLRLLRLVVLIGLTAGTMLLAGGYLTRQMTRDVSALLKDHTQRLREQLASPDESKTVVLDFCEAAGIGREELHKFLDDLAKQDHVKAYPLVVTLQNAHEEFLTQDRVVWQWDSGTEEVSVSANGAIGFLLSKTQLPGLRLVVPEGYVTLKQRTLSLGAAAESDGSWNDAPGGLDVLRDSQVVSTLARGLARLRTSEQMLRSEELQHQLQRKYFPMPLSQAVANSDQRLTPQNIYRQRKRTVVVVCHLLPNGNFFHAAGVVLDPSGIIATCYHVMDRPESIARGIMTWNGKVYPILEVVAANRVADIALIRVDASSLEAAPLSHDDVSGAPVTIISHPGGQYFTLTQGTISRYWLRTEGSRGSALMMTVTADFADGSSGAPVFNDRGEVTGLVQATRPLGYQMVCRFATSAHEIRSLIQSPEKNRE